MTKISDIAKINAYNIDKSYSYKTIEYIDIASVENRMVKNIQSYKISDAPSRAKRIVHKNDILISTVRPNLKHFTILKEAKSNRIASTGFVVITVEKADPFYLYYYLTTDEYTEYLSRIAASHTSAYPSFNPEVIANTEIILPPIEEQKAIAKILSSLDDKIELNRQMNGTLEQIAQAIFKRWFIDYEFPDENGNPYKSSGGEMVDSEVGDIPRNWEIQTIGELYKTTSGGTPSRSKKEYYEDGTIKWVKSKELNNTFLTDTEEKISNIGLDNSSAKLLPPKTVLIAMYGATAGELSILTFEAACNQAICAILPNEEYQYTFLFEYLKVEKQNIINKASGSAQQNLNQITLQNFKIKVPTKDILELYHSIAAPIYDTINCNVIENENLSQMRNLLLPKLISGEIGVPFNTEGET